jgi:hypothetical protein
MARILPRRWSQKIPPEGIPNESPPKAVGISPQLRTKLDAEPHVGG